MNRHLRLILMAAGNATRYGKNKLLVEIAGKPMFRHILDHLIRYRNTDPGNSTLIVVSQYDELLDLAGTLKFDAIRNDRPDEGIARTIRLSLVNAPENEEETAVFFTGDQPYISYETVKTFLDQAKSDPKGIVSAKSSIGMGNPVSFDKKYYDELRALKHTEGGRLVMLAHQDDTSWYEAPEHEMRDIDRPGDVLPKL